MGSIIRRDDTWRLFYDLPPAGGRRQRKTETVRGSYHDALQRLQQIEADLSRGQFLEPVAQPLSEFMVAWLRGKTKISDQTARLYEVAVRLRISPALGGVRVCDLRAEAIDVAVAGWLARDGPDQARLALLLLRAALGQAVRRRRLAVNEAALVEMPAAPHREMACYTVEQVSQLLPACRAFDQYGPAIAVAVLSGLRIGELLALRWSDVDLAQARLHVRRAAKWTSTITFGPTKTAGAARTVSLMADAVPFFEQQRRWQADIHGYWPTGEALVFTHHLGGPLWDYQLREAFQRKAGEVGLPVLRFHDLRHTYATWALGAGVPVKVVSEALGHSSVRVTLGTYAHCLPEMQQDGVRLMSAALASVSAAANAEEGHA